MKRGKASNSQAPWRNRITGYGEESPNKLLANPFNFRVHPDEQQAALSGALRQVGIVQNVLVNRTTGHVIDGHMRAALAIQERQPTVPVTYVEMSEAEERIVLASFDKISSMAEIDQAMLDRLIGEIRLGDVELNPDVDALIQSMLTPEDETTGGGNTDEDEVPETPSEPVTKLGDLWLLGRHRVLCGDSTASHNTERLVGDVVPFIMVTDPLYGVEYSPEWRDEVEGGLHSPQWRNKGVGKVSNDDRMDWTDAFKLFPGDVVYCWHADRQACIVATGLESSTGFCVLWPVISSDLLRPRKR